MNSLLIFVSTAQENAARRNSIRNTWKRYLLEGETAVEVKFTFLAYRSSSMEEEEVKSDA